MVSQSAIRIPRMVNKTVIRTLRMVSKSHIRIPMMVSNAIKTPWMVSQARLILDSHCYNIVLYCTILLYINIA